MTNAYDKNMSKFIKFIDKMKFVPAIDNGVSLLQPVNARDLGKAYYIALTQLTGQKSYDLTGDRPITIREVYQIIARNLNKKIYIFNIPLSIGVFVARLLALFSFGKVNLIEKVQRMAENRSYSHEKAKLDFNYTPMPFEEGIKTEVEQYLLRKGRN